MPSTQQFENNVSVKMVGDLSTIATSLTVQVGAGELFPSPTPGTFFLLTIEDLVTREREICRCTERVGDLLTIVRAQEGTPAQEFVAATSIVQIRVTRDTLAGFSQLDATETHTAGKWTEEVVLTSTAGAVSVDTTLSNCFYLLLTENVTIALTDGGTGQVINLALNQNGTGGWTVGFAGGNVRFAGGAAPTFTATAGAVDMVSGRWVEALSTWLIVGIANFAAGA